MTPQQPTPPPLTLAASALAEIRWPAFPSPAAANQLAMQFQLEQSQWWDRETLATHQLGQIDVLLRDAASHIPHYRETLADLLGDPSRPLTEAQFQQLPILTRAQVQALGDQLVSRQTPPAHGKLLAVRSSGSTGRPVRIAKTELCNFFWKAFSLRAHLWHRSDFSATVAAIRLTDDPAAQPPTGQRLDAWGPETADLMQTGPTWKLSSGAAVAEQAAWLARVQPRYLVAYPSTLAALLLHHREHGLAPPALAAIRTVGEVLPEDLRALARDTWGVPILDSYSAEEVGHIAIQCPTCEQYHVQAEGVRVEVLDADDRPCAAGETGRVVVTPLHNFATPLIRYEIGDYATVGEPCGCGRGLPTLVRIAGRAVGMAVLPDGRLLRPHVGFCDFADVAPVRQAQLVQVAPDLVEARLVSDRPLTDAECEAVTAIVRHNFDYPMRVRFSYLDAVPRSAGGKFEVFLSRLQGGG